MQNEPNDPVSGEAAATPTSQTVDVTGSSAATPTNGFRAFVRRRELVIFFALSYLIAWSTLPFGTFLAFAPLVSAIVVVADRRGLAGAGSAGSAHHSLAGELDLVRGCYRSADAGPRGGHRSEHGGRRTRAVADPVPAVVRGAVAVWPPDGESHRRAAWGGARLARLCSAAAAIEVVTLGVSGPARAADHRLASATGLHAAVRPRRCRTSRRLWSSPSGTPGCSTGLAAACC